MKYIINNCKQLQVKKNKINHEKKMIKSCEIKYNGLFYNEHLMFIYTNDYFGNFCLQQFNSKNVKV